MKRAIGWIGGAVLLCIAGMALVLALGSSTESDSSSQDAADGSATGRLHSTGRLHATDIANAPADDTSRAATPASRVPRRRIVNTPGGDVELTTEEQRRDDAGWGPQLWRRKIFATDAEVEGLAADLAAAGGPQRFLRLMQRAGGEPEPVEGAVPGATTRFQREPERMARLLEDALAIGGDDLARQSLIFHLAIAVPPELAAPRLWRLVDGDDPADAEDALCALAFVGEPDAVERFVGLSAEASTAHVRLVAHDAWDVLALAGEHPRAVVRSYRCVEALSRAPYFHRDGIWAEGLYRTFPWARSAAVDLATSSRLLPAWLARYPGHPGSDDIAYRMARLYQAEGRQIEALRWASRCSTYPDQDMREAGVALILALVELAPPGDPIVAHLIDPAEPERNRELLTYLGLRRQAQELGPRVALDELARIAASEPHLLLSRAYRERWTAPVTRGLDSGTRPLPADDPLRRIAGAEDHDVPRDHDIAVYGRERLNLRPTLENFRPSLHRLRRQLRAWETLAELERRHAAGEGDRADLLYKQGAVHYRQRDILYPVYANHTVNYSGRPSERYLAPGHGREGAAAEWLRGVLSWDLAIERFEAVLRTHPTHALADDALYSIALAHVKAADSAGVRALGNAARAERVRAGIDAFDRLITRHPGSRLARAAGDAGRYWRTPGLKIPRR